MTRAVIFIGYTATLLLLAGCDAARSPGGNKTPDKTRQPEARQVKVARVTQSEIDRTIPVVGSLVSPDLAVLSMKVSGRMQAMPVDLGSQIKQGQLLAQVEKRDYELKLKQAAALLAQARARVGLPLEGDDDTVDTEKTSTIKQAYALLEEAEKNRDRIKSLSTQGIVSQSDLETAAAAYEVAANKYQDAQEEVRNRLALLAQRRAEYDIARQQLADTAIYAPFDGAVQERRANLGEYLTVGAPVLTLVRMDPLRLRVEIPERASINVRVGQQVRLSVEGKLVPHLGEIKRISPALNNESRVLIAEADVPNPEGELRPGSFVRGDIITRSHAPALTIPTAALFTFAGLEKIFVVEKSAAVERNITTGDRSTNWIEIVSGAKDGETVVLDPGGLQTGQPLKIAP